MTGKIWGGNNYSFDLLQGTKFCPQFNEPYILLLEGEDCITSKNRIWQDFIRNLDSIMLLPGAKENITGLLIGSFPETYMLNEKEFEQSVTKRDYLANIPILYEFPRGYKAASLPLPIGEHLIITVKNNKLTIDKL